MGSSSFFYRRMRAWAVAAAAVGAAAAALCGSAVPWPHILPWCRFACRRLVAAMGDACLESGLVVVDISSYERKGVRALDPTQHVCGSGCACVCVCGAVVG